MQEYLTRIWVTFQLLTPPEQQTPAVSVFTVNVFNVCLHTHTHTLKDEWFTVVNKSMSHAGLLLKLEPIKN